MKKNIIFISIFLVMIAGFIALYFYRDKDLFTDDSQAISEKKLIENIKKHYGEQVITTKQITVYKKDKKYVECGKIGKGILLSLEKIENFSANSIYFKIKDTDYYVPYRDVEKTNQVNDNKNYKSYIPFNKSIVMNHLLLYKENELVYDLPEAITAPILIDDEDKKYIEYNNDIYYAKKEDIEKIIDNGQNIPYALQMTVLNYHFFYEDIGGVCNEILCLKASKFEEQMKYLSDNEYYTPTMKEFEMFLDKKIKLPKKSVMITVDDGAMGTDTVLPRILEKYHKKATLFLITGWNDKEKFKSSSMELHSHTDAMHNVGDCPGGQGGGIKCLPKETVLADLQKTRELLNNTTAFAYPFYEYNDRAISLLKEAGFSMAFIGGNRKATPGVNKMLIPRYPILSDITLNGFIKKIS